MLTYIRTNFTCYYWTVKLVRICLTSWRMDWTMLTIRTRTIFTIVSQTHLNKLSTSSGLMSLKITIGCSHGFAFNNFLKYGLQALRTTLWAVNDRWSHANVTSTKSSSSRKWRNDDRIDAWKSFHFNAYCCSEGAGDAALRSILLLCWRCCSWCCCWWWLFKKFETLWCILLLSNWSGCAAVVVVAVSFIFCLNCTTREKFSGVYN